MAWKDGREWHRSCRVYQGSAIGLILGWLVIRGVDWGQVRGLLQGASVTLLLTRPAIFFLGTYLRALR